MRVIAYLGFAVLASLFSVGAWAAQIGQITALSGAVSVNEKPAIQPALSTMRGSTSLSISARDILATEAGSKVKVLLQDNTILTLSGETQLQVDKRAATLGGGIVRALIGKGSVASPYILEASTARVSTQGGYFIAWTTECEGSPATGVLGLEGDVTASDLDGVNRVGLAPLYYTYIGARCPPPIPLPASPELYGGLVASTEVDDQVRVVVAEVSEGGQLDPQEKGVPIFFPQARRRTPSVPPIAQTGPIFLLTRVRVNIDFR